MVYISNYAIITGATGGIGMAIARELAADGYNLVLVGKNRPRLNQIATDIQKDFKEIEIFVEVLDLTLERNCEHLIDKYSDEVEILVNNAGMGSYGFLSNTSSTRLKEVINLNVMAPVMLTRYAIDSLHKNHGYIMNVAAHTVPDFTPKMTVYGASKSFMSSFSESLRQEVEMQNLNISVTTVYPPVTDTDFYYRSGLTPEQIEQLFQTYKPVTSEQVAKEAVDALFRQEAVTAILPNPKIDQLLEVMRSEQTLQISNVKSLA